MWKVVYSEPPRKSHPVCPYKMGTIKLSPTATFTKLTGYYNLHKIAVLSNSRQLLHNSLATIYLINYYLRLCDIYHGYLYAISIINFAPIKRSKRIVLLEMLHCRLKSTLVAPVNDSLQSVWQRRPLQSFTKRGMNREKLDSEWSQRRVTSRHNETKRPGETKCQERDKSSLVVWIFSRLWTEHDRRRAGRVGMLLQERDR